MHLRLFGHSKKSWMKKTLDDQINFLNYTLVILCILKTKIRVLSWDFSHVMDHFRIVKTFENILDKKSEFWENLK